VAGAGLEDRVPELLGAQEQMEKFLLGQAMGNRTLMQPCGAAASAVSGALTRHSSVPKASAEGYQTQTHPLNVLKNSVFRRLPSAQKQLSFCLLGCEPQCRKLLHFLLEQYRGLDVTCLMDAVVMQSCLQCTVYFSLPKECYVMGRLNSYDCL